jgi:hypothetical protein
MFSAHLPRTNTIPREYIYFGAGVALVASLLIAIASVASGEVQKAAMRDSALASQRSAAANCVETRRGAELNRCLRLARRDSNGDPVQVAGSDNDSSRTAVSAENTGLGRNASVVNGSGQGLIQASFGSLR